MVCSQTARPPALLLMLLLNAVRRGEWFGTAAGNVHHHHHDMETNVYRLFVDLCSTLTILKTVVRIMAGRSVCQPFHQCWIKDATKVRGKLDSSAGLWASVKCPETMLNVTTIRFRRSTLSRVKAL